MSPTFFVFNGMLIVPGSSVAVMHGLMGDIMASFPVTDAEIRSGPGP